MCGCRLVAPRLRYLGGHDILGVLRVFPQAFVRDIFIKEQLTTAVNARCGELRSWKSIQELKVSTTRWRGE